MAPAPARILRRLPAAFALLLCAAAAAQPVADHSPDRTSAEIKYRLDYGLWGDRIHALYDLEGLGPRALPLLSYATEDADWQVRLTAVHFLGKAGPDAVPALAGLTEAEPCPFVRISALKWLSGLGETGRARYAQLLTPDDQALISALPDHYGTERMGRAIVIDPPDGEMTSSFLNGGIDLRVCASSERSGHRHQPPASSASAAAPAPAPEEAPAPETLPDAKTLLKRLEPENPIAGSPGQRRHAAEPDAMLTPTGTAQRFPLTTGTWSAQTPQSDVDYATVPERSLAATDLPSRIIGQSERFPQTGPGWSEQEPQTGVDYATVPARSLAATDLPGRDLGPREELPKGQAMPWREKPETKAPGLAPDVGTGKLERDPVPTLIARLSLTDPRTRARAADELGKYGAAAKQAVRPLRRALKDRDRRVRASAALALGSIGVSNQGIIADLKRTLHDRDEDVRFSARLALDRLGAFPLRRR
jgi:hypothetical protein